MNQLEVALSDLEQGDFHARWDASKRILAWGETALPALLRLLQTSEEDWELQWFVALTLGQFHHADALKTLVALLDRSQDPDVSQMANQMLAQMGNQAIDVLALNLQQPETRPLAVQALAHIVNKQVIPLLLPVLEDDDPRLRRLAMQSLSQFHDQRIIPALLQGVQDVDAEVRMTAITGISYLHPLVTAAGLKPVDLLSPLLQDLNPSVCQTAALALGRLGTDIAVTALGDAAQTPNRELNLRIAIVQALGRSQSYAALGYLQQLWFEADALVLRTAIIQVLGQMEGELKSSATDLLLSFLASHPLQTAAPSLYQEMAMALGYLQSPIAIPALIQLLAQPHVGIRLHAIAALKQINPQQTYQELTTLNQQDLGDPLLQAGIAMALREWS